MGKPKLSKQQRRELLRLVRTEIDLVRDGLLDRFTRIQELADKYKISSSNLSTCLAQIPKRDRDYRLGEIRRMNQTGRIYSKQTKEKMSKSAIERFANCKIHPLSGTKLSKERKRELSKLKKGKNNPMYGKKWSKKSRTKLSKSLRGKRKSEETRKRMSEAMSGENNPNFNGWSSIEPYTLLFMKVMRDYVRERDRYKCQSCGGEQNGKAHQVHHIDYEKENDSEFNLITLCHQCHSSTSTVNGDRETWRDIFMERIQEIYSEIIDGRLRELAQYRRELETKLER